MGMGSGSIKKHSSAVAVVLCAVLGLALFVVGAAAKDSEYCKRKCRHREDWAYCYRQCIFSAGDGAAMRLAAHREAGEEAEARKGGGRVGGQAGRLAMPTERVGREKEEERKQVDVVLHLSDPVWCYDYCRDQKEKPEEQCVRECYAENMPDAARLEGHGGIGGEETRGGGGGVDALTAAAMKLTYNRCRGFVDCSVKPCVLRCMRQTGGKSTAQEDEETRTGALNVMAAARHEVAVGACSSTVYVQSCYACCQREVTRNPDFDWYACIRSCHNNNALPMKKERENKKDGVVPPAK